MDFLSKAHQSVYKMNLYCSLPILYDAGGFLLLSSTIVVGKDPLYNTSGIFPAGVRKGTVKPFSFK